MEHKKLRVGIAGYGVVGKRRREFIDANPKFKTVGVCDQNFDGNGTLPDGIYYCRNYTQLLEIPLDVLFVSLPNYLAAEVTIAGLRRGLHVFCEKPPGRNVSDIKNVIEVEKENPDVLLKYGFNHRYHDSVRKAKEIIDSGDMGKIVNVRGIYGKSKMVPFIGEWRSERKYAGGGILLDQGIHMVDLMQYFCGEFKEVKSFVSNSYWGLDVEDNAYAMMRDEKGRIAMLHSSATQWQHQFGLYIALEEGHLELLGILSGSKSYGQERLKIGVRDDSNIGTTNQEIITFLEDNSWRDEINEFADSIGNGVPIRNGNSLDALRTMELVYRIYWSDPGWRDTYNIESVD